MEMELGQWQRARHRNEIGVDTTHQQTYRYTEKDRATNI